ncbi:MAG: T9SS type A sorting domain-containing protein [Acholeplasmataceae bacterium]
MKKETLFITTSVCFLILNSLLLSVHAVENSTDSITLKIAAAPEDQNDMWIDLNNNNIKDTGESVTVFNNFVKYALKSDTAIIHGKTTDLQCSNNRLISLNVSKNTALRQLHCEGNLLTSLDVTQNVELDGLYCYNNYLTGEAMTGLINSLSDRELSTSGLIYIFDGESTIEKNEVLSVHSTISKDKNWTMLDKDGVQYPYASNIEDKKASSTNIWSTEGKIHIKTSLSEDFIRIYNISGVLVFNELIRSGDEIIIWLSSGMYIVKSGTNTEKLLIN